MTEDEIDRRFHRLVATLNSRVVATDGLVVAEPLGGPDDGGREPVQPETATSRLRALRALAVATGLLVALVGSSLEWSRSTPVVFWAFWLLTVIPGVTLAVVLLVDRLWSDTTTTER